MRRLADFDEDEWARVERAYAGRLIAYIGRRVSDAEARDDIVQEVFLGAVRGIGTFDEKYSFEQYLFGICRNRTIDHLRKRRMVGAGQGGSDDGEEAGGIDLASLALDEDTPSQIVRRSDVQGRGRELLRDALREWVQETWAAGEFNRLMVVEALFRGGWRNRDTWERFGLRDETAVAGVKFRALKKLREFVAKRDPDGEAVAALAQLAEDGDVPMDVASVWSDERVSCPARHWLARWIAGTLEEGPREFMAFHVDEMGCEWCSANRDDLARRDEEALLPLLVSVRASTAKLLRSRIDRPSGP
ncbi:RNA polymerase sigma factor RpoE [Planctomycetes bacterium Poly30]|uniref:RNA polymerase sigma factor RpoE n=1 Tax=Saltatorellus ferox TaxID=2528018 RepID=A0A518EU97_9BACT|nr:RNA polymerase sigma factor RpoE [Planctomycetes bacterium Poly30]